MNELEIVRHSRIPGLTVFFNTVDYRTPHFHSEWELVWLLDAPMQAGCGGQTVTAQKGDLLLFGPDQPHEMRKIKDSSTFLCLQVSPELLGLEERTLWDGICLNGVLTGEEIQKIYAAMGEILRTYLEKSPDYALFCRGKACLLFHFLFSRLPIRRVSREEQIRRDTQTRRLTSLMAFVDENYTHRIRLSDFAEREGFSMSYLSHFIKKTMNQSFQEYVKTVRVNCACKLMAAGGKNLTEICLESGFSDYRYFSEAFKKQFGITPEQYRLSAAKPEKAVIHHSIHSLERFYTDEQSKKLLAELLF